VASALAYHDDTHIEAATPVRVPSVHADSLNHAQIEFSTQHGTGKPIMLGRTWQDGGRRTINGSYLEVRSRSSCLTGWSATTRTTFRPSTKPASSSMLTSPSNGPHPGVGELSPGQTVRGAVAFDIPHGGVTLLMSDDTEQSITALKVPGLNSPALALAGNSAQFLRITNFRPTRSRRSRTP
jgi:hypothetical protein